MANLKNKKRKTNADVYKKITNKIIEALKGGRIAWQKPWVNAQMPMNYVSGKPYRGINRIITFFTEYTSPYWVTYNQAKKLGGNVKKGEKGTIITFWKILKKPVLDEAGQPVMNKAGKPKINSIFLLKEYTVFNAEQCEGIEFKELPKPEGAIDVKDADELIKLYKDAPEIKHSGVDKAYYSPMLDGVHMPNKDMFNSTEDYYSVLFHELAHSTGAKHRLNREGVANFDRFGSHQYSVEELIAEMSACFMMANAGLAIEPRDNSKAYIQSWIERLENDPKFIFTAARDAQKACDYMQGLIEAEKSEDEAENKENITLKCKAA